MIDVRFIFIGMMLILASNVFAYTACDAAGENFQGAANCLVGEAFGGYYDFAALFLIGAAVLIMFAARIPGPFALMIGIGLTYGLYIAFGASQLMLMLMLIQALGFVIMIGAGFFQIGKVVE